MNNKIKLTTTAVEKLRFPSGAVTRNNEPILHFIFWDVEQKGLGVRLSANSDTKTYVLQHRVKGSRKQRSISLGKHGDPVLQGDGKLRSHAFGADDARNKARKLIAQLIDGIDPIEEKRRKETERTEREERDKALGTTLRQVMEKYLAEKKTRHGPLRPATKNDIRRHVEKNLTTWLDEPVAGITRNKCLAKFREVSRRAPLQANSMAVYLRALLNYAREMHATDDGDFPILAVNPITRMFKIDKPNPEKVATTRIPLNKVGACWMWLRKRAVEARSENDRTAADWLSFILLTGCRRLESGSLRWSDVNLETRTIRLRAEVVKSHSQLVLPMSDAMHALLSARKNPAPLPDKILRRRRIERQSAEFVFASNGVKCPHITNAQASIEELSRIAGEHVHVHALRRTFDDIAMECKIDGDVRRMLLNHKGFDVHARHYGNNTRALAPAVEAIAQWIEGQSRIAEARMSGANVLNFADRKTG